MVKRMFEFSDSEVAQILATHVRKNELMPFGNYLLGTKVSATGKKGYIVTLYIEENKNEQAQST